MFDPSSWGLETALRAVLLLALCAWAAWWALGLLVAMFDRRTAARIGPPLLRAVLAAGAIAAATAPAHAGTGVLGPVSTLDGLALPDRPLTAPPTDRTPPFAPAAHLVQPGDCLWTIVRDRSPGSSDARIAADVARWHDANRDVIGPDPDLISPGQRLVPPGAS